METSESEPNPIRPFDRCFHASIQCKDLPALCAALVAPDVDVNKLYRKKTPLILAIQSDWIEGIEILLGASLLKNGKSNPQSNNINVDAKDGYGFAPLHYVALLAMETICTLLIDKGAKLDVTTPKGQTPLHLSLRNDNKAASDREYVSIASLLVDVGSALEAKDKWGYTPMHRAADRGFTEVCARISKYCSRTMNMVCEKRWGSFTPLMRAVIRGHIDTVEYLLESGADVGTRSDDGRTTLIWAASHGHTYICKRIIERGGSVDDVDGLGETALLSAIKAYKPLAASFLIHEGANTTLANQLGEAPLMCALKFRFETVCQKLIDSGCSVNPTDNLIKNRCDHPLLMAAASGDECIVRILTSRGAQVDARDHRGLNALYMAVKNGHKGVVKALVENSDCDINSVDGNGDTMLHQAVRRRDKVMPCDEEMEDILIKAKERAAKEKKKREEEQKVKDEEEKKQKEEEDRKKKEEEKEESESEEDKSEDEIKSKTQKKKTSFKMADETEDEKIDRTLEEEEKDEDELLIETTSVLDDCDTREDRRFWNWTEAAETAERREVFARRLLALGAEANIKNQKGESCLDVALKANQWLSCQLLVLSGCALSANHHQLLLEKNSTSDFWWEEFEPMQDDDVQKARGELHLESHRDMLRLRCGVLSLKHLARIHVRLHLGPRLRLVAQAAPDNDLLGGIPAFLKDFLLMKH